MLDNFIVSAQIKPCWICGKDTRFIDVDFEAYIHPGDCSLKIWSKYWKALNE